METAATVTDNEIKRFKELIKEQLDSAEGKVGVTDVYKALADGHSLSLSRSLRQVKDSRGGTVDSIVSVDSLLADISDDCRHQLLSKAFGGAILDGGSEWRLVPLGWSETKKRGENIRVLCRVKRVLEYSSDDLNALIEIAMKNGGLFGIARSRSPRTIVYAIVKGVIIDVDQ